MKLLLDSHAYLWWLVDDERLSPAARKAIADPNSLVFVSAASVWELAIKAALGRLDTEGADLAAEIEPNGLTPLPISAHHAWQAGSLPPHHSDPFDRILIAQAEIEGLTCVTHDRAFSPYGASTLW